MKAKIDIRQDKRNGKEYAYILDECFYGDEHKGDFTTDEARLWLILSCFKNWDCEHERRKFPILSDRIGDWLRGLPSVCSVDRNGGSARRKRERPASSSDGTRGLAGASWR